MTKITEELSFTLVGEFMSKWAISEHSADEVIASALGLTPMQYHLLSTTIPVANKLELTKTMILLSGMNEVEKTHYTRQVNLFFRQIEFRNIIAHYMFYVSADGTTVNFIRAANKGKLNLDEKSNVRTTRWTVEQFKNQGTVLDNLTNELTGLQEKVLDPMHYELSRLFRVMKKGVDANPFEMAEVLGAVLNKIPEIPESQDLPSSVDEPQT